MYSQPPKTSESRLATDTKAELEKMQFLLADLRYAWHRALHQPGVTLSIITLLALGMGGVTAVFNPIYSTLYAPLPFPQPEQLVRIGGDIPLINSRTGGFHEEKILGRVFSSVAAYDPTEEALIRIPDTDREIYVNRLRITGNFFETLGVRPLIGYDCTYSENDWSNVVVSHRFWRNELNQKTDAIGSPVFWGAARLSILGIMPDGFHFPFDTDIWLCGSGVGWYQAFNNSTQYIGRLRPEISAGLATEMLQTIDLIPLFRSIGMVGGLETMGNQFRLESLQTFLYGDQRPLLRMLGVAAILFLTLVCAGVINLLIVQGLKRKQEMATRLIFGASRSNLVFQLIRETLPLVVIGGLVSLWISEIASSWMWTQLPALQGGVVDVPVQMAFWAALVLVVTLIGGLIPALYATGLELNTYLKATTGGRRSFFSTQEFLVGVQLSLALALLIGMGVLIRSMMFNIDIPVGWSSRDIVVVSIIHDTSGSVLMTSENVISLETLSQDILREISTMPEAMTVGALHPIPFSSDAFRHVTWPGIYASRTLPSAFGVLPGISPVATINHISSDGFAALGIPLIAGRHLTEADSANFSNSGAVIINQALAQYLWPEENPIGKTFYNVSLMQSATYEVVGVVRNYHQIPGNRDFIPAIYFQGTGGLPPQATFLVKFRPGTSLENFHSNVRQRLSGFNLRSTTVRTLSEIVNEATANQRLAIQLLICFAILGIFVSGLAVYATATLAAAARTKETGIRIALGAQIGDILRLAFWRGIRAIIFALPFGLFLSWILAKILAGFLVQINIGDTLIWVISCAILFAIATVAALIPALRATRVDPLDALRND